MFNHPKNVCMNYFSHMCLSLRFSYLFFKGSIFAIIHAFIPDILIASTTSLNNELYELLKVSGCR